MFCFCIFFFSSRRRHTRCALVTGVQTFALPISQGSVPTARISMSYFGGYDPIFRIPSLPFVTQSQAEVEALWGIYHAPLEEFLSEEYDQVVVSAAAFPPSGIWTRKPLESLGDLKGLKLRTFEIHSPRTFKRDGPQGGDRGFGRSE